MGQLFCLNGMVYSSSTTEKAACEILPFSLEDKTSYAVVKSAHSMQVPGAIKNIEKNQDRKLVWIRNQFNMNTELINAELWATGRTLVSFQSATKS